MWLIGYKGQSGSKMAAVRLVEDGLEITERTDARLKRWEQPTKRSLSGCHLNRSIADIIAAQTRTVSSKPPWNGIVIVRNRFLGSFTNSK